MKKEKKGYPVIALRPDKEFYTKIGYLQNYWKCTKSYAIREAVNLFYHNLRCSRKQKGIYCSDCGARLKPHTQAEQKARSHN